jgi:uncharacterized protein (DUF488 family)
MGAVDTARVGRPVVYTIGHSNLDSDQFLSALKAFAIDTLVDVRSMPYSRFAPWFNREALKSTLETAGIEYRFAGDFLGGRPTDPTCYFRGVIPPKDADFLQEVDYAEVARRPWFRQGIERVLMLSKDNTVAIMCSEEDPNQCHRYHLIAQALLPDANVVDIRTAGRQEPRAIPAMEKHVQPSLL